MRLTFLFVLLIFGICLVIHVCMSAGSKICKGEEYTIVDSNGTFIRCLACGQCHPGWGLEPKCGSSLQHPPKIACHACKPGTFSTQYDSSSCLACHQCAEYESITAYCSNKFDTVCSGKCKKGYYLSKMASHSCQKCSTCCLDGKDEKIPECVNQDMNKHCSARLDKNCDEDPGPGATNASKGRGLSTTSIILIVFGGLTAVVIVVLSIVIAYRVYGKRKRNRQRSRPPEVPAREQRNGSSMSYVTEGPRAGLSNSNENPLYQGTPVAERSKSPHAYVIKGPGAEPKNANQNPLYQGTPVAERSMSPHASKPDASPQQSDSLKKAGAVSIDEQVKLLEEKGSAKPSLSHQESQDSQTSGDGDAKFRKRSGSGISFEKLGMQRRKLSERDESLMEEDLEEERERIKIIKHPRSQTANEGAKVELKCKVQGKHSRLLYQWLKDDGSAVPGQKEDSLVLKSVELRDFGHYMCCVSYDDNFGEGKKSSPAKLDVIPQNQNGMRPKLLQELDINTRDEVASLLENKRFSLGGCRQVAASYGMKNHQIEALNNSKEPGKDVLEFLMGSKPNLTVYDFCKVLKEDKIERFDIVQKLEDHFLIPEGTEYV